MNLRKVMAKLRITNIRICVWFFFTLVVIGPVCLGAGLVSRLGSDSFSDQILASITGQISTSAVEFDMGPVVMLLKELQLPLLGVLLFILGGSVLAIFLFIRYFVTPMDKVAEMAHRITNGNLGATVPVYSCDEINRVGESFNDLSTNLQEVVLLVWNFMWDSSASLDRMIENSASHPDDKTSFAMQQDLVSMRDKLSALEEMVAAFELYDVHVEGNRALADSEPWRAVG